MRTLKLTVSYDGTAYCGWQVQTNGPTIQGMLERAFAKLGSPIRVVASGRTDAGVHAHGQVVSCRDESEIPLERMVAALNGNLPRDIRVQNVELAPDGFHAIRDSVKKRYRYILQTGSIPSVFRGRYTWFVRGALDVDAMNRAGQGLVGKHDFSSYEAAGSERKTSVRTILDLIVVDSPLERNEIFIEVEADGFLYNMVRNIVGTLVEVGQSHQTVQWPAEILEKRDRKFAGKTAPPQGLYLLQVTY
jgi:tRNA pseudouridine38-40 synthase